MTYFLGGRPSIADVTLQAADNISGLNIACALVKGGSNLRCDTRDCSKEVQREDISGWMPLREGAGDRGIHGSRQDLRTGCCCHARDTGRDGSLIVNHPSSQGQYRAKIERDYACSLFSSTESAFGGLSGLT